jgi:hypothetical protein
MRLLRGLLAFALTCGLAGVAKAQSTDFQMIVVDPTVPFSLITPIYSDNFTVSLSPCQASQLEGLSPSTYLGCFTGENITGTPLTSITMEFPTFPDPSNPGQNDAPSCAVGFSASAFSTSNCSIVGGNYVLQFSGGNIPSIPPSALSCYESNGGAGPYVCDSAAIFTIAEAGITISPDSNPFISVPTVATVPESRSLALLAVDVFMSLGFVAYLRRRVVCISHPE